MKPAGPGIPSGEPHFKAGAGKPQPTVQIHPAAVFVQWVELRVAFANEPILQSV